MGLIRRNRRGVPSMHRGSGWQGHGLRVELIWRFRAVAGPASRAEKDSSFSSRRSSCSRRSTAARGRVSRSPLGRGPEEAGSEGDIAEAVVTVSDAVDAWDTVDRGDAAAGVAAGEPDRASRGGSGRLAVRSDREIRCRRGPRPRTTPSRIVVRAGMRSSRSVKSDADRIGWPSSATMPSPGWSPASAAGVPASTSRRMAPS